MAEIAQQVERRVESACAGGSNPSLGTRQSLVSSTGKRAPVYEAGGCAFESCTRYQPSEHLPCRASSTGRAAASKAEGSRFDPVVRRQTSRRSQVVESDGLQSRRRKPASVRSGRPAGQDVAQQRAEGRAKRAIGPSSPGLVSSADQSSRLLPGGSAVRIGHEAPVHFPDSADGRAPGC